MNEVPTPDVLARLAGARAAEKDQALFYRALAAAAEDVGDASLAERLNYLLADEQHHLSRLTVRLVELGHPLADLHDIRAPAVSLEAWEEEARRRERAEVDRYERLLALGLDARTRAMLVEIVESERAHASELGGKWMEA